MNLHFGCHILCIWNNTYLLFCRSYFDKVLCEVRLICTDMLLVKIDIVIMKSIRKKIKKNTKIWHCIISTTFCILSEMVAFIWYEFGIFVETKVIIPCLWKWIYRYKTRQQWEHISGKGQRLFTTDMNLFYIKQNCWCVIAL